MSSFKAVLFDLDGTLLDSIRLILDSYHHTLAAHGIPARSDAEWLAGIGTSLMTQLQDWAGDATLLTAMVDTYRDYNISNHDQCVSAFPGGCEVVRELRGVGILTGLVTSKMRTGAERGLRFLGLVDAMDVVVAADDVVNPKPHPEPLLKAAATLGLSPAEILFVGDSVHDMVSGRAAGTTTAAALWGPFTRQELEHTEPDHWLEHPRDVLHLVRPIG